MTVITEWKNLVSAQGESLRKAATDLEGLCKSSAEHWEGAGFDSFIESVARRVKRLGTMSDACVDAANAAASYVESVNKVRVETDVLIVQASKAKEDFDEAQFPPSQEILDAAGAARQGMEDQATKRHNADQTFLAIVLRQVSGKLRTDHRAYERMTGDERVHSTVLTTGLLELFALGKAPRDLGFTDDAFAKAIAESGHMTNLRDKITARLKAGDYAEGEIYDSTRSLSSEWMTLGSDFVTTLSGGIVGNLTVTALGGYYVNYEIVQINGNEATITYSITNDTTRESLNRIPGLPIGEMPWAPAVNGANLFAGGFQPTGQAIIWTETITF